MSFVNLGLQESFAATIADAGYENPTELQEQLIPLMTQRKSVIVWSQSAAGKTGAFLIPAIDHILDNPLEEHHGSRILVLTSRRDRVNQITYTVKRLLDEEQQIRTGFIVSGRPYQPQMRLLRRPLDLMIATPGRLNDLVDNNKADFSKIELLIIDDLTAIYKKGLSELIDKVIAQKPVDTPVVAFVRPDDEVTPYIRNLLTDAEEVTIEDEKSLLLQLPQVVHKSDDFTHKLALLDHTLGALQGKPTIIFTNSSKTAKTLADHLATHGHNADSTHLLDSEERNLEACTILIAPDEEGFVPEMSHDVPIIHFEVPEKAETYINRVQQLLNPEKHNEAITLLATHAEHDNLKKLEEFLGEKLESRNITGLEPKQNSRTKKANDKSEGRKPQQRKPGGAQANRGKKPSGSAAGDKQQRARKGPYGRTNNTQRKSSGSRSTTPGQAGGNYEIGGWESKDNHGYAAQKPDTEKKVVIRYKEKKRRTLVK
ncbi:MAG: DEAD/DEAH box helicase [uncultured Thiotrichaceae bacterium]|uniref:DEAD/DEAH box helicase n=1 Tax=uncultured Thiotrichaceae bacterium TaxID=298394 RepID=A0A6S6SI91_9GAMM|nr:MAG: DEAD/DEAH box helicase [uncultured Thiotrichaceae bacterium]